ncbi:hypothetical protein FS837_000849 [Tulasnella sp. UAMH 9824]|nr:hypothetical protein FS837_000849 [Tulasnella sp. UAMH 9824]
MNIHSGETPYKCRIGCGHPPFRDPSSRIRHEYERHAPPGFECPEGCGGFKRKILLQTHIAQRHRDKASTYTEEQLSSKMNHVRFKIEFLWPAIERAKARRRAEGYRDVDEDYDTSESESGDSSRPLALVSGKLLAAAAAASAPFHEGDSTGVGQGGATLDPNTPSAGPSEDQEEVDEIMEVERAPSPSGQWVQTRDAQNLPGRSSPMQTVSPRSAPPSPPSPPLPMPERHIPHSPKRSFPIDSTPITAAPRLAPTDLPAGSQIPLRDTPFPDVASPTRKFTNNNALGLSFGGSGMGNNNGLPYFSSRIVPPIPTFPITSTNIDPTKHYYRRAVGLPVGSHGQGFFSSPPSLMGSPALGPAHQPVDANTVTLGGLAPSSRGVTDLSFLEDEIMI